MKVGDKVYYYEIIINVKGKTVNQIKKEFKVIGWNEYNLCLNDEDFTTIKHTHKYLGERDQLFNEVVIWDWINDSYFNSIRARLYTSSPKDNISYRRAKRALEKHIKAKYAFLTEASKLLETIKL